MVQTSRYQDRVVKGAVMQRQQSAKSLMKVFVLELLIFIGRTGRRLDRWRERRGRSPAKASVLSASVNPSEGAVFLVLQ